MIAALLRRKCLINYFVLHKQLNPFDARNTFIFFFFFVVSIYLLKRALHDIYLLLYLYISTVSLDVEQLVITFLSSALSLILHITSFSSMPPLLQRDHQCHQLNQKRFKATGKHTMILALVNQMEW
jgi:hypothetical protein